MNLAYFRLYFLDTATFQNVVTKFNIFLIFLVNLLALLLALVSRGNVQQAKVPMFEAPSPSRGIVHNGYVCDVAGF